jgi:hypothetical protein
VVDKLPVCFVIYILMLTPMLGLGVDQRSFGGRSFASTCFYHADYFSNQSAIDGAAVASYEAKGVRPSLCRPHATTTAELDYDYARHVGQTEQFVNGVCCDTNGNIKFMLVIFLCV